MVDEIRKNLIQSENVFYLYIKDLKKYGSCGIIFNVYLCRHWHIGKIGVKVTRSNPQTIGPK